MFVLFTDTDTDMTPKLNEELGLGYKLISMPYTIDGVTYYPYKDNDEIKFHEFYDKLRAGTMPVTSALNPEEYKEYFEPYLKKGNDIVYVHFSKNMSGTFNALNVAISELLEVYPDRKIELIDTTAITIISLVQVIEIGKMFKGKATIEQVKEWAEKETKHFACYFFADSLKFFKRSGRVSGIAGTMGDLIGIKPIIYINDDGKMDNIGKERGRSKAIAKLVQYVKSLGDHMNDYEMVIGHADNIEIVNQLKIELNAALGEGFNPRIVCVNPTIGSHCGPDTMGIAFHAIHR